MSSIAKKTWEEKQMIYVGIVDFKKVYGRVKAGAENV